MKKSIFFNILFFIGICSSIAINLKAMEHTQEDPENDSGYFYVNNQNDDFELTYRTTDGRSQTIIVFGPRSPQYEEFQQIDRLRNIRTIEITDSKGHLHSLTDKINEAKRESRHKKNKDLLLTFKRLQDQSLEISFQEFEAKQAKKPVEERREDFFSRENIRIKEDIIRILEQKSEHPNIAALVTQLELKPIITKDDLQELTQTLLAMGAIYWLYPDWSDQLILTVNNYHTQLESLEHNLSPYHKITNVKILLTDELSELYRRTREIIFLEMITKLRGKQEITEMDLKELAQMLNDYLITVRNGFGALDVGATPRSIREDVYSSEEEDDFQEAPQDIYDPEEEMRSDLLRKIIYELQDKLENYYRKLLTK